MKTLWCIFWLFFVVPAMAQVSIYGVVSGDTKQPVPYATIGVKGSTRSVMSNENGVFKLEVTGLPQILIVSAIGFETHEFILSTDTVTIQLTPKVYTITEVTIKGDDAYRVFNKAYKRLMKPGYLAFNGKLFYRLVTRNDTVYTELMEGFYDVQAGPTGFNEWQLRHGRYAIADDYKQQHYVISVDFSALVKFVNIINDHGSGVHFPEFPFQPNASKMYTFSRMGSVWLNNKEVSKIQFSPQHHSKELFSGIAYIDEASGNIHRLDVAYTKPVSNLVSTQGGRDPVKDLSIQYTIGFTEDQKGNMLLNRVNTDLEYTYQLRSIHTHIDCFVYEKDAGFVSNIKDVKYVRESAPMSILGEAGGAKKDSDNPLDYVSIKSRLYIKPFWDEHTVIAQTPLQQKITQQFEQKGSFGMAYSKTNDTLALLREGYAVLGRKVNRLMVSIPETPSGLLDPSCIDIQSEGMIQASLCSQVFASFNCYKDSFLYLVLPLLDTSLTWMSDSIKQKDDFSAVFQLYARLCAVYARKLHTQLADLKDPCLHEQAVFTLVRNTNEDLYNEQLLLLNDLWKGDEFIYWHRYLEKLEKEN